MAELLDWLTLLFLPGLGLTRLNLLLDKLGTAQGVLNVSSSQLAAIKGIGHRCSRVLQETRSLQEARARAQAELERVSQTGIQIICRADRQYPPQLRTIPDPPLLLYCKGDSTCLHHPGVAMVGSRAATLYGKRVSYTLARDLATRELTVISGLALGIDTEAHRGALAVGGRTVAVLGCGLDVVYPRCQENLYAEIAAQGCLISEYPLGTRPERFRFPARNRIISGLSHGTIIVEATIRSGSLITARLALDQGREVFAVPGRIDSPKSEGCHRLIQQGAHLVHTSADICAELELGALSGETSSSRENGARQPELEDADENRILSCLDVYPMDIDTLQMQSGLDLTRLHGVLLHLELKGLVRKLPGQQYERTGG